MLTGAVRVTMLTAALLAAGAVASSPAVARYCGSARGSAYGFDDVNGEYQIGRAHV